MNSSSPRKKILIVDDHPLVREGLAVRISAQPDLEVCGEAEDAEQALAKYAATAPDLVIVDISLKTGHGLELIKQIKAKQPRVKTLVISAYDESIYAERALRAGALGYIGKQECRENVIVAIRTVLDGRRYLSPQATDRLVGLAIGSHAPQPLLPIEQLTDREMEVFQLIGQGQTTGDIAEQLHLSPHTIESHRAKIKTKLKLSSGADLTRQAIQWVLEHST